MPVAGHQDFAGRLRSRAPLGILLGMMPSLVSRLYVKIVLIAACMVLGGACLGFSFWWWRGAVVGAILMALLVGALVLFSRRRTLMLLGADAAEAQGSAEGAADAAVIGIFLYQAAVDPLTPGGVSEEEREARRSRAYQIAASEALPRKVQVSAAAALEVLDEGQEDERAQAALEALVRSVYESRADF
ncbi:hypothetical protein JTP67_01070 [Streptomyces sp. S12]|nr:hypothetical protein [Streptomyces sp. S12]